MKDIKKQDLELEKMISKKGTKEELINNANKIGEKMINKRQPYKFIYEDLMFLQTKVKFQITEIIPHITKFTHKKKIEM